MRNTFIIFRFTKSVATVNSKPLTPYLRPQTALFFIEITQENGTNDTK